MSELRVFQEFSPRTLITYSNDQKTIRSLLDNAGIGFEQWHAAQPLPNAPTQQQVIDAYRRHIDLLMSSEGYKSVDVVSMQPNHPDKAAMRAKFIDEHRHSEDEVRFFVAGQGLFSLHTQHKVYEVLCTRGDLIRVPANTRHWFDMGPHPHFVAIRLFTNPEGWVAQATGSDIAKRFSRLDA